MKKRDFFSKFSTNNYNNELEKILEKKEYPTNAKNLLLSMLYKVEFAFKDYETIKRLGITQKQFIEEILNIIKDDCDQIEIVEPKSKKGKILAKYGLNSISNDETKNIIAYPSEKELIYALYQLPKNSFKVSDKYYFINNTLPNTLKIGNSINNKEIIRDFDGWSWNTETKEIENYDYNLMYQSLRILVGYAFLQQWRIENIFKKDYLLEMKNILIDNYGNLGQKFYDSFLNLSISLNIYNNKEIEKLFIEEKKSIISEIEIMSDKTMFLDKITEKKKNANKKIKDIDKIVNNRAVLEKEYNNKNLKRKHKIENIDAFEKMLKEKRKKLINDISKYTRLMDPKKYTENIEQLKNKYKVLKNIDLNAINDEWKRKQIIALQKIFLNCIQEKVENTKIKAEIVEIIYHLRYYKKLAIKEDVKIEDVNSLNIIINEIEKKLISKACDLKILNTVSKKENYNFAIIKTALNSDIINLENIELEIKPKYDKLQVYIYDTNILDKQYEIETNSTAEKVDIRTKKRFRLFS